MKKALSWMLGVTCSAFILMGCDNSSDRAETPTKPSIASMIASGTEERTVSCKNGSVSLDCEYLSGDLLGTGKWHYAKTSVSNDHNEMSLVIDNESFFMVHADNGFTQGTEYSTLTFKGLNGNSARITTRSSNSGSNVELEAWNDKNKKFMTISTGNIH